MITENSKSVNNTKGTEHKEEAKKLVVTELTDEAISVWKNAYGKVFRSVINKQPYIWRKLKRKEYIEAMNKEDLYARQEELTKICILFPGQIDKLIVENAGLATSLSDEILAKSGFDIENTVEL